MGEAGEPTPRPNPANGDTVSGETLTNDPKTATWDDVLELERIYDIIWGEIEVTRDRKRRRALVQLSVTVKVMAVMTRVYLIGRGVMPPWVKGRS